MGWGWRIERENKRAECELCSLTDARGKNIVQANLGSGEKVEIIRKISNILLCDEINIWGLSRMM